MFPRLNECSVVGGVRSMVWKWKYWYELRHKEGNIDFVTNSWAFHYKQLVVPFIKSNLFLAWCGQCHSCVVWISDNYGNAPWTLATAGKLLWTINWSSDKVTEADVSHVLCTEVMIVYKDINQFNYTSRKGVMICYTLFPFIRMKCHSRK